MDKRPDFLSDIGPAWRLAILILSLAALSAGDLARAEPVSPLETGVLAEINAARADPHAYADGLRRYRAYYHGRQVDEPGRPSSMTSEGVAAVDDAISYLDRQSPMPPLQASDGLSRATRRLAVDLAPALTISHVGADGSTMRQRMQAAGVWAGAMEEDISVSQRTARDVVRQLIIDDGVPTRGHRTALFDPILRIAGVACGQQAAFGSLCVIDLAGAVMAAPGSEHQAPRQSEVATSAAAPPLRSQEGAPPAGERRFEVGELVIEVANETTPAQLAALAARNRLETLDSLQSELSGTTLLRSRVLDGRSIAEVILTVEADPAVISAQPNYDFALQAGTAGAAGAPIQYAAEKLRLAQAHALATGRRVLVGMIDTGVDAAHPDLRGAVAAAFDAAGGRAGSSSHGTAIAALIAGHGRLTGSAPEARLLAVRAFSGEGAVGRGTTFALLKGLDWLAAGGARVVNMSFAGPRDPELHRSLEAANHRGIVLIAAAGNAGPTSPPLYPAADPDVIAVSATDADDRLYPASNRGGYIQIAAPGVDVLVAAEDGGYDVVSGTSFAAAEVSGIAALLLEEHPRLTPAEVRGILLSTSSRLGSAAQPRLVDAYRAVAGLER